MIFIDTSAYIAILNPNDSLHNQALNIVKEHLTKESQVMTSYAILGEVLTVGSIRYNRQAAIDFVTPLLKNTSHMVLESEDLLEKSFKVFKTIKDKNVGWVDCLSFAIIEEFNIKEVFSFDKAFKKYTKAEILAV